MDERNEFIKELLANKFLRPEEREKVLDLAFEDTGKDEWNNKVTKKTLKKGEYRNPKNTSAFLREFNQDQILKYTCHTIDQDSIIENIKNQCGTAHYDLRAHQILIAKSFKELSHKYSISTNLYKLINNYINGGTWSEGIKSGWKSPDVIYWSNSNLGLVPNPGDNLRKSLQYNSPRITAFTSNLSGRRIRNFSELCIHFKHLFHIRSDNSLKDIITRVNEKNKWNDTIQFDFPAETFLENMEVFTYVDQIINAYKRLIKLVLEVHKEYNLERPRMIIEFNDSEGAKAFSIHHLNTKYRHTLNDSIRRLGETYEDIISYVNGLCNFFIQADFGSSGCNEINIWDGRPRQATVIEGIEGVRYVLRFKQ